MIEKLKHIHHMFYARPNLYGLSLCFYFLRADSLVAFLFSHLLYCISYLGILITENKKLTWLFWIYLLAYIAGNTFFVGTSFCWFYYYLSNILALSL